MYFKRIHVQYANPTNTPRGLHVETTWKRSFPRRFNVEFTWCVCREAALTGFSLDSIFWILVTPFPRPCHQHALKFCPHSHINDQSRYFC